MNLLEHYIKHIYSEKEIHLVWDGKKHTLIVVDMDIDCYGREEKVQEHFFPEDWEHIKEQGFYMA